MLANVDCPYCGEPFEAVVEPLDGDQRYIEDCPVCCRPIEFCIDALDADSVQVSTRRDDD